MTKNKFTLLILTVALIAVVSGCGKKQAGPATKNNNTTTTTTNSQIIDKQPDKKEWQGEVISEKEGWKKYRNDYYGIEFRFLDKENIIKHQDRSKNRITFLGPLGGSGEDTPYIDMLINDFMRINHKSYDNLNDYLKVAWNTYQEAAELVSIEKLSNGNNIDYFIVKARVSGGGQVPGYLNSVKYYFEYNYLKDKDYIGMTCHHRTICEDIVKSYNIK